LFPDKKNQQSLVSLTFDDGLRCQFRDAVPILNELGMPATFFLIANQDPTHESWEGHKGDWWKIDWRDDDIAKLKQLIHDGHEVGSHSISHRQQTMQANPSSEACDSKKLIEDWLDIQVTSFCYPYYRSHAYLAEHVKNAGYDQARGGADRSFYTVAGDPNFDRFNIDCRQISSDDKVSDWLQPGCWHVLTFHAIGDQRDGWKPISKDQFTTLMAELAKRRDSGDVDVLTFKSAAARMQ
jgi:peptidoglycan/xylan/chitin deacetylase (PgdA/CDA1 family)